MNRKPTTRWLAPLVTLLALACTAPPGAAQTPERVRTGSIVGTIVDARTALPLPEALVVLEPRTPGALPAPARGSSAFVQATRTVRTDTAGRYRFGEVPAGEYRLHVQRPGYHAATVEVDLGAAGESRVSVGLDVQPVALEPLEVSAPWLDPGGTYGRPGLLRGRDDEGRRRIAAERLRQELHLPGDVRAVTGADVAEGITLGETDLFRALQRLPGVSAGDEYSAELWTRGAPWDQTRVYFDGLPLFNPVHALGGFTGVNPDAVGAAFLHPGMQPASLGGGVAGALDIRSRRGGGSGAVRGAGELSLVSARAALDGGAADGRQAWMAAGRRTYLDLATGLAELLLGRDKTYRLPYDFSDLAARYDHRIGEGSALEVSGLAEYDRIFSHNANLLDRISAAWGGGAARATLRTELGGVQVRHTLGFSGFDSRVDPQNPDPHHEGPDYRPPVRPSSGAVLYTSFRGELEPAAGPAASRWSAGYELQDQEVRFRGPFASPLTVLDPAAPRLDRRHHFAQGVLWGERRWAPSPELSLTTGARLEAGPAPRNAGALRLAPRLAARVQLAPGLTLSAAAGRTFQYVQAVAPSGAPVDEGFRSDYLWVLAGDSVPAARADVATLGAERWLGAGWLGAVNLYARRTVGVTLPDPTPGTLLGRPLFVEGTGTARGAELSARRLAGRWTASLAYTYGVSEMEAAGRRFPAPSDQRHVLDATGLLRLTPGWQVGAAYTLASGVPYTRTFQGRVRCDSTGRCTGWVEEPWADEPGARRAPAYQSLDLLADWTRVHRGWSMDVYVQLRNALNHANPGRYVGFGGEYCVVQCGGYSVEGEDDFRRGLPLLPVVGARVVF